MTDEKRIITEKTNYSFIRTKRDFGHLPTAILTDYRIPQEIAARHFRGEQYVSFVPVISVRKGSSLKDKNIRDYRGEPLLKRAIRKTRNVFGSVCYVIADSEEYAEFARGWGAIVPFVDTPHTDKDTVSEGIRRFVAQTQIADAVQWKFPVVVALVQCTSPNTSEETIGNCAAWAARRFFSEENLKMRPTLFSGYEMGNKENAIYRVIRDAGDGGNERLEHACGECAALPVDTNRQELNKLYGLTGGVFCVPLSNCVKPYGAECAPRSVFDDVAPSRYLYVAPESESLDIDKAEDFLK